MSIAGLRGRLHREGFRTEESGNTRQTVGPTGEAGSAPVGPGSRAALAQRREVVAALAQKGRLPPSSASMNQQVLSINTVSRWRAKLEP
jgi:hypothetical protein